MPEESESARCAQCQMPLTAGMDREVTDGGVFCRSCFDNLAQQVRSAVDAQTRDVNYTLAFAGGLAGAAIGILAWWGFTVLTHVAFGLIAVAIGLTVGKGVTIGAGGKRGPGLQALSVGLAVPAFFYASYLVNRTFVHRSWAEQGETGVLPWVPGPALFLGVVRLGFGIMDLVFLAIVVWQAWKIPAPLKLEA